MANYIKIIRDYVELSKANYALMLNGEWGNGKTYFLQNVVIPFLKEMGKKPVYVSLNGVKTVDEVSKQIFLSTSFFSDEKLKDIVDSKAAKYATQLAKGALSVASTLGFIDKLEHQVNYEDLINLKNDKIVLCFDDLERCKIDIIEILGFINAFVEQDDVRTIIVGNENEIKDVSIDQNNELKVIAAILAIDAKNSNDQKHSIDDIKQQLEQLFGEKKQYDFIKEKLIGKTITYKPDASLIINEMIKEYSVISSDYFNFLTEHKEKIIFIFNKSERKNLRIIKHSLSDFYKIHSLLEDKFKGSTYFDKLIHSYFLPALITSIEHKEGKISTEELNQIPSSVLNPNYSLFIKKASFYGNYFENMRDTISYNISEHINIFLATSDLDETEFLKEAQGIMEEWSKQDASSNEQTALQKLINNGLAMENHEFEMSLYEVITKVKQGEYNLRSYPYIFYHFESFDSLGLLSITIEEVINIILEGIEKSEDLGENGDFRRFFIQKKSEQYLKLELLIQEKIQQSQKNKTIDQINCFIDLLPSNPQEFITEFIKITSKPTLSAAFYLVDVEKLFDKLRSLNNSDFQQIYYMFYEIYDFGNIHDFYKQDYDNVNKLIQKLENDISNVTLVRKALYTIFINTLIDIAERLNK